MGGKERGAGEGSIYRRKDGRWVGQYEVEGKRRYVYGQDREGVRAGLTKAFADRDAGLVFDSRKPATDTVTYDSPSRFLEGRGYRRRASASYRPGHLDYRRQAD